MKRIDMLVERYHKDNITKEEVRELKEAYATIYKEVDEYDMAKLAFKSNYIRVYRNEENPQPAVATPGKWIIDSTVVAEFASDYNVINLQTDEGDYYYLKIDQEEQFANELNEIKNKNENQLLTDFPSTPYTIEEAELLLGRWTSQQGLNVEELQQLQLYLNEITSLVNKEITERTELAGTSRKGK